ncbi:MAG TPA: outer membrane beta-barrel protein [Polyangiaceae bacterium]|nr:outer membrane beta-barrel protein [Polyangiaceae bacterium]
MSAGPTATPAAVSAAPAPADDLAREPFAFGDFSWLNGSNRQSKALLDTPIFTGSLLLDVNYSASRNMPIDNTVVGSTVLYRNSELTVAFLGFGGDLHYEHARGRFMTQLGVRSTGVPRNDFSTFHGQYDLQTALRYVSEANGGYHWDLLHGVNLDAGIFMSYVGLFSFANFENWMYMPSYTSDNTPWFFNGVRLQMYLTETLKIEPWIINGWQTYGKFNEMPGFGSQVLFRPADWLSVLSNWYVGWDAQDQPGLFRWHTDTSGTVSYYHNPKTFITRIASSYTIDVGGEQGDGVAFTGSGTEGHCTTANPCAARFVSGMMYHRVWFGDTFAVTVGGGFMSNPSRYLVLPPTGNASPVPQPLSTQGVQYVTASSPYDLNPGTNFNAWDYSFGLQYMPVEQFTFDLEWNHRQADVPYFAGHGGVTSPDGYITTPTPGGWRADLVKSDDRVVAAWLVRF